MKLRLTDTAVVGAVVAVVTRLACVTIHDTITALCHLTKEEAAVKGQTII